MLQYWLQEVKVVADVYDPARFAADPGYARHVGQLNVLTWLIEHGDSNLGNFLISKAEHGPARVLGGQRRRVRLQRERPRATPGRTCACRGCPPTRWRGCAASRPSELQQRLGVLAQWRLEMAAGSPSPLGANLATRTACGAQATSCRSACAQSGDRAGRRGGSSACSSGSTTVKLACSKGASHETLATGLHSARASVLAAIASTALALAAATGARAGDQAAEWSGVERVVAFADVHGAYEELTALLRSTGVVDAGLHWTGGRTHLVSLGDLLDRGADSRKVMDLLMRLQGEAAQAGGRVHVVIGNHEAMNVLGDLRYVDAGEFAAYAADEDPAERARRKCEHSSRASRARRRPISTAVPAGLLRHQRAARPGRALRPLAAGATRGHPNQRHRVHAWRPVAGAARAQPRAAELRTTARRCSEYLAAESALDAAGLLQFEDDYARRPETAAARIAALAAAKPHRWIAGHARALQGGGRRPAARTRRTRTGTVARPLQRMRGGRRAAAVAAAGRRTARRDRSHGRAQRHGRLALRRRRRQARRWHEPGRVSRPARRTDLRCERLARGLRPAGHAAAAVPAEPLYLSSQQFGEDIVADILARGTISVVETCAPGVLQTRVTLDGRSVDAVFEAAPGEVVNHELAAYRLDRLLGLGMVPATVARSHEGRTACCRAGLRTGPASRTARMSAPARASASSARRSAARRRPHRPGVHCRPTARRRACRRAAGVISTPSSS